jgi:uncharacterized integral membrane protein (TIGR00698 family)
LRWIKECEVRRHVTNHGLGDSAGLAVSMADPDPRRPTAREALPGVVAAVGVAVVARMTHGLLPPAMAGTVGDVIVAMALGVLVANVTRLPPRLLPGLRWCVTVVLRLAIVLLGARLAFEQVLAIGGQALGIIVVLMAVALLMAHALARLTHTPPRVASLVGVGVSVCGNTAIVATAPAIGASDDDVATAIAVNTLFGTIAVFTYPLLARALGLEPLVFGTWVGTAVNDTSQVVAAGFAYGTVAGQLATTVKLARNALMGVVIVGMGLAHRRTATGGASPRALLRASFPLFVVGFLALALANSLGVLAALSDATGIDVAAGMTSLARALLLVSLAAVGLSSSASGLRRAGWRPFAVGLGAATITSAASFALIQVLGPAGA